MNAISVVLTLAIPDMEVLPHVAKCNVGCKAQHHIAYTLGKQCLLQGGNSLSPVLLHPCIAMQCMNYHSSGRFHCLLLDSQLKLLNLAAL